MSDQLDKGAHAERAMLEVTVRCAIGRIFRIMSRPFREGDIEDYERARRAFLQAHEALGHPSTACYEVNYARDRLKGAPGD